MPDDRPEKPTHIHLSHTKAARVLTCGALVVTVLLATPAFSQTVPDSQMPQASAPPATLVYGNRPITELRARVLARTPAERVAVARSQLDAIVTAGPSGPVTATNVEGVIVVSVGNRNAFVIMNGDVDELAGETLEEKAALAASRLQTAVDEEIELRTPARLVWAAVQSIAATMVFIALLWAIQRGYNVLAVRLPEGAEQKLSKLSAGDLELIRASKAGAILRRFISSVAVVLVLFLGYSWLTFVLRRFPYTRPLGESLREFLLARFANVGLAIVRWVPDLFTIILIVVITRFVSRLVFLLFEAAGQERLTIPLVYPETAQPTRRLVTAVLWMFALALSYPYLPGSDSDAFKGMSVFVGLIVSLGSSGIVGQAMSGLTLTFSRALRLGDYVAIGDVEGTVIHLGSLSTKIKTPRSEDVTIPNAVVVSTPVFNYSRFADVEGVLAPTTVTVGYDVPWRQIHALLSLAAERTPDVRRNPVPVVRQSDFQDFAVKYTVLVSLEQPHLRHATLSALRANIQDVFNEFGVQIMVPAYESDPGAPKIVPREKWFTAPALPPSAAETR